MLKKVSVTYHAPKGDEKVTETFGHTFHDGKPEEVEIPEEMLEKLKSNPNFECGKESDAKPHFDKTDEKDDDKTKGKGRF